MEGHSVHLKGAFFTNTTFDLTFLADSTKEVQNS